MREENNGGEPMWSELQRRYTKNAVLKKFYKTRLFICKKSLFFFINSMIKFEITLSNIMFWCLKLLVSKWNDPDPNDLKKQDNKVWA